MMGAALPWDRSAEGHHVAQSAQVRHKTIRTRRIQVLGNLQAIDQIEAPIQSQRLRQIAPQKSIRRN